MPTSQRIRPASVASAPRIAETHRLHAHLGGHLGHGGTPRCGCDVAPVGGGRELTGVVAPSWSPVRRQLVGFVRTRFIYSDRMAERSLPA